MVKSSVLVSASVVFWASVITGVVQLIMQLQGLMASLHLEALGLICESESNGLVVSQQAPDSDVILAQTAMKQRPLANRLPDLRFVEPYAGRFCRDRLVGFCAEVIAVWYVKEVKSVPSVAGNEGFTA